MTTEIHTDVPEWIEPFDHTADIGIAVRAPDLKTLFERAAWAMFSFVTDLEAVRPLQRTALSVQAPDREALLVKWLSELNFHHTTNGKVFSRFDILQMPLRLFNKTF